MPSLGTLTPQQFRERLAGLSDPAGGDDLYANDHRERASDYVLLLALCFNHRQLNSLTMWARIESAIQKGLAECDNVDVEQFVNLGLTHVLAPVNVVAAFEKPLDIQESLYSLGEDEQVAFLQYLAKHIYPAIVAGRRKYQEHKALRSQIEQVIETEVAGNE